MSNLAFAGFDFVATEAFFRLCVGDVLTQYWVVLTQRKFAGRIHRVLYCVVSTITRFVRDKSYKFSFRVLLCHNKSLLYLIF